MKRTWIGMGLLLVFLALGIGAAEVMERNHVPGADALEQAAELAMAGDWAQAEKLTAQTRAKWEKLESLTAALNDHEPMDEIDGLFAQLGIYAAAKDAPAYSGTCVHLASLLEALGKSHSLNIRNIL